MCMSVISFSFTPVRPTPKLWRSAVILIVMHRLMGFRITKENSEKHLWLYLRTCFQRGLMEWGRLTLNVVGTIPWLGLRSEEKATTEAMCLGIGVPFPCFLGAWVPFLCSLAIHGNRELSSFLPCDGQNPLKLQVVVFWQVFCYSNEKTWLIGTVVEICAKELPVN